MKALILYVMTNLLHKTDLKMKKYLSMLSSNNCFYDKDIK